MVTVDPVEQAGVCWNATERMSSLSRIILLRMSILLPEEQLTFSDEISPATFVVSAA